MLPALGTVELNVAGDLYSKACSLLCLHFCQLVVYLSHPCGRLLVSLWGWSSVAQGDWRTEGEFDKLSVELGTAMPTGAGVVGLMSEVKPRIPARVCPIFHRRRR